MNCYKHNKLIYCLIPFILSCNNENSISSAIKISAWGADVSSTKNVLETGLFEGEEYQYVVSSYPVISDAINNNSNIKIYENITEIFSSKYNVNGFPQAGLFINSELENNIDNDNLIKSFLSLFDNTVNSLISGNDDIAEYMNKYSSDINKQKNYFGFNINLLKEVIKGNKMSFISIESNPNTDEFNKFNDIFEYSFNSDILSKYYLNKYSETNNDYSKLKISVPYGAPAASMLPLTYINDELNTNLDFTTPNNIKASLLSGNKDFLIFDSTTGMNINNSKYKLVRMLTYGNLYLVSTGKDKNSTLDSEDKIFAYGENLITGKVTKAVYER